MRVPIANVDLGPCRLIVVVGDLGGFPFMIVLKRVPAVYRCRSWADEPGHDDGIRIAPISDERSTRFQWIVVAGFFLGCGQRFVRHPYGYHVHEHLGLRGNASVRQAGTRTPSSSRKLNV